MTNEVTKKKQLPAFLVLTIICLIAALALAATNAITKDPIQKHKDEALAANFRVVLNASAYEQVEREGAKDGVVLVEAWNKGTIVDALASATVTSDAVINAVNAAVKADNLTGSAKGFQSDVTAVVTLDETGAIATLTVDSSAETMGLGTRCGEDEAFIGQFIGKTAPFVREEGRVGYCVSASAEGYGGAVAVTLGVNEKGEIVGAKIGDNTFRETDTIGGKWLAAEKAEQFIGINLTDGGAIDTIAGATVTSDAVKAAANKGADVLRAHLNIESDTPVFGDPKPVEYADSVAAGEYSVTAAGFQSDVKVDFTVDENSTITALTMDTSGETPNYGTRCGEDEGFVNQFIGKTVPVTEFDVLSGASITSNAVVKAINSIAVAGAEEPAVETSTEETPAVTGTAHEAAGQGFQSEVKVTVYTDDAGVITGIEVDASGETQGLGTRCGEDEAFLNQFIGKTAPVEADVISGATVTSNAVINAVNAALTAPAAGEEKVGKAQGFQSEVTVTLTVDAGVITGIEVDSANETPGFGTRCGEDEAFLNQFIGKKATPDLGEGIDVLAGATVTSNAVIEAANAAIGVAVEVEIPAADALTATVPGYDGENITVTVTLDENGNVATLVVDASTQTPGLGQKCAEDEFVNQFIGAAGPFALGENVDAVSYATITSQAVVDAVNSVLPAQEAAVEETPAADLTATVPGYDGENITVTVTLDENGNVATLVVDASTQTPGLGQKCAEDEFVNQFIGAAGPFVLGENVDAVSYATITSQAVVDAVNSVLPTQDMSVTDEEVPAYDPAADLTATVPGYDGENITVTVTLDENGNVATLVVDASTQTPGLGQKCAEDEFVNQFIGAAGPFVLGENVDAVSYATITSQAVVDAVNSVLPTQDMSVTDEEVPAYDPAADLTATVPAFDGENVTVTVTLDENGNVATLVVDASTQTPGLGQKCAEDEFVNQFIGAAGPFALGENVDAVSYATITSQAVVDAVNSVLPTQDMSVTDEEVPAYDPAADLTATVPGYDGENITVTVTLDENGNVATLVVDASTQTPGLGQKCAEDEFVNQFIGAAGPFVLGENVDAVSYATITSQAVVDAVNSVLPTQDMSVTEEEVPAYDPAADLTATVPAFDGENITVTVTLDENGNVATLVVDASTQTPGLGQKCAEDEFVNQFIGAAGPFVLGENVDAVSYATITSQAVVDAVNSVLPAQEAAVEETPAADLTATVPGYDGENITVTVTLDENGNVATLVVDASTQTPGLGQKCAEDEFVNQFIGAAGPFVLGENVDAVSYATITSQAVVDAVNSVLPTQDMSVTDEEVPAYDPAADLTATVPGYDGENITVTVTLDENGNVATLVVDASTQTPGLGQKCAEDEFVNQFIGAAGPFVLGENVDAVSYATITSQAVVDAVNSVLPTQDMSVTEETPAADLTATVPGYDGENITVTVTVDENGNVATLVVDASTQTPGLGQKCAEDEFVNQFIGAAGPFVLGENVDAVSYATITSQAVVDVVNQLIGK